MKKYALALTFILFAGMVTFSSCGDNKAEEEARLQAIADSLRADSLAQATALEDSLRMAYEDSVAMAMDSLQNALDNANSTPRGSSGKSTKTVEKPNVEVVKEKVEATIPPVEKPKTVIGKKQGGGDGEAGGSVIKKKQGGDESKTGGSIIKKKGGGNP